MITDQVLKPVLIIKHSFPLHLQTPEQIELIFREAQKPLGAALQQEPPEPYIGEQEVEASLLHSMNNPSWGWQDP